jgi:hypothetical protein
VESNAVRIAIVPIRTDEEGRPVADVEDAWIRSFWGLDEVVARFSPLPRERYRVFAMYDANGNGALEFNEPSTELAWYDYGQPVKVFDFVEDEERIEFEADGVLDEFSRMDPVWLDQLAEGGDASALNFDILGPQVLPPSAAGWHEFRLVPWDDQLRVAQYRIWMTDGRNTRLSLDYDTGTVKDEYQSPDYPDPLATWVNFGSHSGDLPPELVVKVEITYEKPDGSTVAWFVEHFILVTDEDPGFWVTGPDVLDRGAPGVHEIIVEPKTASKKIEAVDVEFFDATDNPIAYDGVWGAYAFSDAIPGDSLYTFDVDFAKLGPALTDPVWDDQQWFFAHVKVSYDDGTKWDEWYDISLVSSADGTVYDLSVAIDAAALAGDAGNSDFASWRYWIWVMDFDNDSLLFSQEGFLDNTGFAEESFWNVFDPTGLEQTVQIEVDFDGDGWPDVTRDMRDVGMGLFGSLQVTIFVDFIHDGTAFIINLS